MRLVIQRVTEANVTVDDKVVGEIGAGLMVLVGFGHDDSEELIVTPQWGRAMEKLVNLRIFPDEEGRFDRSLSDIGGDLLLVSQFTLYANCRKGRRPSFTDACEPVLADKLFDIFVEDVKKIAPAKVETGVFGAEMMVNLTNWGPVTIVIDTLAL